VSSACPVGGNHRTGVRDNEDSFRVLQINLPLHGVVIDCFMNFDRSSVWQVSYSEDILLMEIIKFSVKDAIW